MDIALYSLRKWVKLACTGNPTVLGCLFAPNVLEDKTQWKKVVDQKGLFLAKSAATAFHGFADQQLKRVMGEKGKGKHGQRPELEQKFGYDTKAAMHVLRLLGEGTQLMMGGKITYPRPNKELLIATRSGKYDLPFIKDMADILFTDLDRARNESCLPDEPDRAGASQFLTDFYLNYWKQEDAQMNRILARGLNLACRWIAGHLTAEERADGHPQWEAWRDQNVVKIAMIDLAIRAEDK